jgi:hypothetical protein
MAEHEFETFFINMGTKWSSWIWEKHTTRKKHMCRMMIMLCQWDCIEQIEKLVRLLLCTSENCSRKFHAWVRFVPSVNEGLTSTWLSERLTLFYMIAGTAEL